MKSEPFSKLKMENNRLKFSKLVDETGCSSVSSFSRGDNVRPSIRFYVNPDHNLASQRHSK